MISKCESKRPAVCLNGFIFVQRQAALNERKQAEEELRRSETLLATAQKIAHLGSWEWDLESQTQIWSVETFRIFGLNPTQSAPTQAAFLQMLHPEDPSVLQRHLLKAIANGTPFNLEYRIVRPDGSLRYLESRAEVAYDTQGKTIRLYGAILDITERKESELEITKSRDLLKAIFNESADALFLVDTETLLNIDCNNRAVELFAASSKAELIGIEGYTLQKEQFTSNELNTIIEEINQQVLWSREIEYVTKQGNCFWGNIAIKQITVANRVMNLVRVTDITPKKRIEEERHRAEIALKQSEIRYRAIVEDQTELIARYLTDGTITFVNQAYALYFGRSSEELIGSRYQPIIFEADRERVTQLIASMSADNPVVIIENRVVVADGVRWTQWHNRMLFDEQGCFIEYQSVGRDITALKQIEETLFQEKELAQVTLQSIGDAVITTDAFGRIQYLNPVAESLLGCSEASAQGVLLEEVFRIVHETTREKVKNPIEQALQENRIVSLASHTVLITEKEREIAIQDSAAPIRNVRGKLLARLWCFMM
ncbi:MAG: PAS domain S-box protein [Nostoc sp. ChiQUE01a]|nr:PAS domain S-box protein [Nostoc sp. ChiQUE01a]